MVHNLPTCGISGPPVLTSGQLELYKYNGGDNISDYQWSIVGNGRITGSSNSSSVSVTAGSNAGTFTLTLSASNDHQCTGVCNYTIDVSAEADITVTKTDWTDRYFPGSQTTYQIVVFNNGPGDAPFVTINDPVPTGVLCTWVSSQGTTGIGNIYEIFSLPAGNAMTYTVTATIPGDFTGELINSVTVTGTVTDPILGNNTSTDIDIQGCISPQLTVGPSMCETDGQFWRIQFYSNGVVSASAGTVSGSIITGIPLGTPVSLVSSSGTCSSTITAGSPVDCGCRQPDLSVGQKVCLGNDWGVSFTESTGSPVRASAGVISGNMVTGIPMWAALVLVAGSGDCTASVTVLPPTDCDLPCGEPFVSLSGPECTGDGSQTYFVNMLVSPGTIISTNAGIVNSHQSQVTAVPSNVSLIITASLSGCLTQIYTIPALSCPRDDSPVANCDYFVIEEDKALNDSIKKNDKLSKNTPNFWSKVTNPSHGELTLNSNGTFKYIPHQDYFGSDSFIYNLFDTDFGINLPSDGDTAVVWIKINPIDDQPKAINDNYICLEGQILHRDVKINDIPSGDGGNVWSLITTTTIGKLVFKVDGTIDYSPKPGYTGIDSFVYSLCDIDGDCSTATVKIQIFDNDNVPYALDDEFSIQEDQLLDSKVCDNDIPSSDGGNLWSVIISPGTGNLTMLGDGRFSYIPRKNFIGTDLFTYKVNDVDGDSSVAVVTIAIQKVNDIPEVVDDEFEIQEDQVLNADVSLNDTPSGDGGNKFILLESPINGQLIFKEDGTFTYKPNPGYNGNDAFRYQLCDIDNDCAIGRVNITIIAVDDFPVAVDDKFDIEEDTQLTGNAGLNDILSQDGGNSWFVTITSLHGSIGMNPSGIFTYTPDPDFTGKDSIRYKLCDVDGDCSTAMILINVLPVDDKPVARNDLFYYEAALQFNGSTAKNDTPSGDGGNTWKPITNPSNGVLKFNQDGSFSYQPNPGFTGRDSMDYILCDVDGDCSVATVLLICVHTDLEVKKIALSDPVPAGQEIVYLISASNLGTSPARDVSVTEVLPAGLTIVSVTPSAGTWSSTVWNIGTLGAGKTETIVIHAKISSDILAGTELSNKVWVTSTTPDNFIWNNTSSETTTISTLADLVVTKTGSASTVYAGAVISYTISVKNSGSSDARAVSVTDVLPGELTLVSGTPTKGTWSSPVWNIGSLAVGNVATLTIVAKVNSSVSSGTTIVNTAVIGSDTPDNDVTDNTSTSTVTVTSLPDLIITKSDSSDPAIAGQDLKYTLVVRNVGKLTADNVVVTDNLPSGLVLSGAVPTAGIWNSPNWAIGSLPPNATATLTITAKVESGIPFSRTITNIATVSSTSAETDLTNNIAIETTRIEGFTIEANDDKGQVNGYDGGKPVTNVLINDFYSNKPATLPEVVITLVKPASIQGIVLNTASGEITVARGTPAGIYTLTYRICDRTHSTICDDALITITVLPPPILAVDDKGIPVNRWEGGVSLKDALINDLLNGKPVSPSEVRVSLISPANDPGIIFEPGTGQVIVNYLTPAGNYEIIYRICEINNPGNCSEAKITLEVTDNCELLIPNGFTPNGDGIGDYWRIKCIGKYPNAYVEILNRWGNRVFNKEHYGNTDIWGEADAWWDGRSNHKWTVGSQKLPPGTYFYILHLNNGKEKERTGFIFLNF